MLDDEALNCILAVRLRALARGDRALVRECEQTLERHGWTPQVATIWVTPDGVYPHDPETTDAPVLENAAQPRPARRRR